MKTEPEKIKVEELLGMHKTGFLKANPEYQRSLVWKVDQKKRLIDSLLRGYPLPLIYLHRIVTTLYGGRTSENCEIIDGQQRINALFEYSKGDFELFDPNLDASKARFPHFIQNAKCDWGRKRFDELREELRNAFLGQELQVVFIETENADEARDLFIRLQAGTPLSPQDKRDAWPGRMNEFILKTAGKPEYFQGHDFFVNVMGEKPGKTRSQTRAFAAQWMLLFLHRRTKSPGGFCDIGSKAVDDLYYQQLGFDLDGEHARRFTTVLDKIRNAFHGKKFKPLRGHEALHLILLVDSLLDGHTASWEDNLFDAYKCFTANYVEAKSQKPPQGPYWDLYGQLARTASDQRENIETRHRFFDAEMRSFIPNLKAKDANRSFSEKEKDLVYNRAGGVCAKCGHEVEWSKAEFHHVIEHHKGGATNIDNCAMVHEACHPKSAADVAEFASKWAASHPNP